MAVLTEYTDTIDSRIKKKKIHRYANKARAIKIIKNYFAHIKQNPTYTVVYTTVNH